MVSFFTCWVIDQQQLMTLLPQELGNVWVSDEIENLPVISLAAYVFNTKLRGFPSEQWVGV